MKIRTGGTIAVTGVDRWIDDIRAGRAFAAGGNEVGGANMSFVQLMNPAGSGITIIIKALILCPTVTSINHIAVHNTALTNLLDNGVNLLSGGSDGLGEIRGQQSAVALGTRFMQIPLLDDRPYIVPGSWFMELGAGEGIVMNQSFSGVDGIANWHWIEL